MAIKLFTLARITITTAGTRQQVSTADTPVTSVVYTADPANTGKIYVGDVDVSATRAALVLAAGASGSVTQDFSGQSGGGEFIISDQYVDCGTNADKVYVSYIKRR